ncbi:hypothetical protein JTE90_019370 [Oedothorax gibbosus]|uniref:Mitochondrial cardiolipin hydrolase n=1 Tax=Oedothorax gibbosus TaxID=931172 RepID=A0AAV6UKF9_9ARAC|nr:hypothetical protein JTE90_019370 [Oedothorax gibbosus]
MTIAKIFLLATCIAVASDPIYHIITTLFSKWRRNYKPRSLIDVLCQRYNIPPSSKNVHKVIFFPDTGLPCRRFLSGHACKDPRCYGVHHETSLTVLLSVINSCLHSLDVCVYMITCSSLGNALIECHERGVPVRVITDERNSGEEGEMTGCQIGKLRAAGINVRCHSSSFWMHHKFLVADIEVLVNGSFNWTNQAVMGNFENLMITSDKDLVHPYVEEFQRLWEKFEPKEVVVD